MKQMSPARHRAAAEYGVTLIEVVVAAVVLFIVSGAVLTVLIGSTRASVSNRDRVTAANLAEQDQERLRATRFETLAAMVTNPPAATTSVVGGVSYQVRSTVKWVNDIAGFTPTCTSGTDGTSDYLQITSVVTPPTNSATLAPQTVSSLLAPKVSTVGSKGTLSIPFADRDGNPLSGVSATLTGSTAAGSTSAGVSGSTTSNASGCAVFSYFTAGDYVATFSRTGYVTPSGGTGTQTVAPPPTVTTGKTNFTEKQVYDRAATVVLNAVTRLTTATTTSPAAVSEVTIANTGLGNSTGSRTDPAANPRKSSFTYANVFPFASTYAAYVGDCAANDPTKYGVAATPVQANPGATSTVSVFAPTLNVKIPGYTFRHLVIEDSDAGCSLKYDLTFSPASSQTVQLPFGTYTVCGDDGSYKATRTGVRMASTTPNDVTFSVNEAVGGTCT